LAERPPLAAVAAPEDVAEELLGAAAAEEMRLVGGALIGVAGRDGDAVEPHLHHLVEEARVALGIGAVEEGAVDVDAEAALLRQADRLDGAIVDALLADRPVVVLAVAVEMDRPDEIGVVLEKVDLLFHQQRVGAEIDEPLARDDALDDLVDLLVEE